MRSIHLAKPAAAFLIALAMLCRFCPAQANQNLPARQVFGPDDPWNTDISKEPVDSESEALIDSIGAGKPLHPDFGTVYLGQPMGIPFIVVNGNQARVQVRFEYANESDAGPYPVPADAPIEGGAKSTGDRHVLVIDRDNWILYELYAAYTDDGGKSWRAGSGTVFDLKKSGVQRAKGWTSADAAGLPIFPGLARYDEIVEKGKLTHALRFAVQRTRRGFVSPATHFASSSDDAQLPPMGMRVRLRGDFDLSRFPATARVLLQGLKTYGMILADNGSDWYVSGAPDSRWNDEELSTLRRVKGSDFEVVRMGRVETRGD